MPTLALALVVVLALLAPACSPSRGGAPTAAGYAAYCGGAPSCPEGGVPAALRRPLHLPRVELGQGCPTSRSRTISPALAPGFGDGPVYALGFTERGVLRFEYPPRPLHQFAGSEWGGEKVLWVSDPTYAGPILIRGRQLDGPNPVRFDRQPSQILAELQLPPGYAANRAGGLRNFPSHTRLRSPGCYAYQVDGTTFSDVIVFEAEAFGAHGFASLPEPVALAAVPTDVLRECRRLELVRAACPRRVPGAESYSAGTIRRGRGPYETFDLGFGGEYPDPTRNRPPAFVHLVIQSGDLRTAFETFAFPSRGEPLRPRNRLLSSGWREELSSERVPKGLFLGRATWGGRPGTLVLAPPYGAASSIHAGHLIFRWREPGREYALSLHAWEPFPETVATLRAVIESIPRPAP